MSEFIASQSAHPEGESILASKPPAASWPVDTPGGRVHAEWCDDAPVTREGSLIFFFQFLEAGGRWEELIKFIPLTYQSNHASEPKDVIGTVLLSVLNGHWRYAHINSLRGDGVNPGLLGMSHIVSEDVVRRALKKMDEATALAWLEKQNREAITPILFLPWILDIDNTVKPLKHTLNVKRLVQTCLRQSHWEEAGEGWQCLESVLHLKGWSRQRRVILVCESPAVSPVGDQKRRRQNHLEPPLAEGEGWDAKPCPWSGRIAVLVTSEERHGGFPNAACVKHYRERADAEPERGDSQPDLADSTCYRVFSGHLRRWNP